MNKIRFLRWHGTTLFFFLASISLFLPVGIFYFHNGSYLAYGNESLAYRYFTTYRLISGETGAIWLPQGFFTLALQKVIFIIQNNFVSPLTNFRASLELFGIFTNLVQTLLAIIVLLVIYLDKKLTPFYKWLPMVFFLILIYGSSSSGIYYSLLPDYYQLDMVMLASAIGLFYHFSFRKPNEITIFSICILGGATGLAIINKISLLFPFMAPLSVLAINYIKDYKKWAFYGFFLLLGLVSPLIFLYHNNHHHIALDLEKWRSFISSPGGEHSFFENLKFIYIYYRDYVIFFISYVVIWTFGMYFIIKHETLYSSRTLMCAMLFGITLMCLIIPLKTRPAGTTNFEVYGSITALIMMFLALVPKGVRYLTYFKTLIIITWISLLHPKSDLQNLVNASENSKQNSAIIWRAHETLLAKSSHALMILPDNSYGIGSVEELLIKGLSEFPSWTITTGKTTLNKIAPNLSIYTDYNKHEPQFSSFLEYTSIMWIDKKEDELSLTQKIPLLGDVITHNYKCEAWPFEEVNRVIHLCKRGYK